MPVVTRSQSASLKQDAVPLNAKGFPSVGGLTIPPATPVVKKRKVKLVSLVTEAEFIELGRNKYSKDPSGKFPIVIKASEMEYSIVCRMNMTKETAIYGKWAVAPDGYYWKYFTQKCYYSFEWYDLCPIPK